MVVWVVRYGDEVVAIYSNQAAAEAHADAEDGTEAVEWTVADTYNSQP
jgi:hypothetical protein